MAWIALVRHARTNWNERGLLQGRTDIPLSTAAVVELQQVRLCDDFLRARWASSPLQRAMQTAAILNPHGTVALHPQLIETDWGTLEGLHRAAIPQRIRELAIQPAYGLDFTPPRGESPRLVRHRVMQWFEMVATWHQEVVAVTHKGVIRSALSAACEWDMSQDFAHKLDWSLPHVFRFDSNGKLQLAKLNWAWNVSPVEGADTPQEF